MRVAVLGATGVFGRHLIPRLTTAGHDVRALVRNAPSAGVARACGAEVVSADIFDIASLRAALAGCDVAINLATSLPRPGSTGGDFAKNDELRRTGTKLWVRACSDARVARVIQQSIAMTHAGGGSAWADEQTFHDLGNEGVAAQAIAAVRDMEAVVTSSELDWLILRGALFYGPGTGFDDDWFARAQSGRLRLPGDGTDYVSLVHVADMTAATVAAIERWPSRQSIIVADDLPCTWQDLFSHICTISGSAPPEPGAPVRMPSFRVRNSLARELLDWCPRYSTYRTGLVR